MMPSSNVFAIIGPGGQVVNIIVASAAFASKTFGASAVQIDGLTPMPGIGWFYLNGAFSQTSH